MDIANLEFCTYRVYLQYLCVYIPKSIHIHTSSSNLTTPPLCVSPCVHQRGSKCQKMVKSVQPVHLTYRNCSSVQAYKPRYCGTCSDSRCCTPHATRTALVEFRCARGKVARRPVMVIQSCACHSHCPGENAVWQASDLGLTSGVRV